MRSNSIMVQNQEQMRCSCVKGNYLFKTYEIHDQVSGMPGMRPEKQK